MSAEDYLPFDFDPRQDDPQWISVTDVLAETEEGVRVKNCKGWAAWLPKKYAKFNDTQTEVMLPAWCRITWHKEQTDE